MRKHILTIILLCITILSQAQQHLGIELAFNRPILRYQLADKAHPLSALGNAPVAMNGSKLALMYECSIIKGFGCRLGISYAIAGNHTSWTSENGTAIYPKYREKYWMHEIAIPVDWQYKFTIAKETYIILYTGPAFIYQLDYKTTRDIQVLPTSDIKNSTTNHFEIDTDLDKRTDYSRLNLTWGIGAGFQYKQFYLRGGYDFGIYNHFRDHYCNITDDTYFKNNARFDEWNIRLGVYFLNF